MNAAALISFILYFIVVLAIGIYAKNYSSKGISEFFIGGRQMNSFLIAVSSVVSGRGTWLLLTFTAQSYIMGISAIWAVAGYILMEFLLFLYYAPRLRNLTEKHECITLPDFYAYRFLDDKGFLRLLLILIILVSLLTYVSSQFVAGGKAFYTNFGLNQSTGIMLIAVIVLLYSILGGFLATSIIDVFQAFFMLLTFLVIPVYTCIDLGGFKEIHTRFTVLDQKFLNPLALSSGALISFLGFGLGSTGNIHILVKYMSVGNPGHFKRIAFIGTACSVLFALGAMSIGIMAKVYFPNIESLPGKDTGNAFLTLTHAVLPSALMGIVIATIFSAIISTADAQLLVTTSTFARDLYEKILNKNKQISQVKMIFISRLGATVLVYIAVIAGLFIEKELSRFLLLTWTGLGASIGPTSILALYWKKTTMQGVITGLITGIVTVIIWKNVPFLSSLIYELIPAFILTLIITICVSLLTQPMSGHNRINQIDFRKTWQNRTEVRG